MSYIGNTATTQAFTPAVDFFNGDGSTVAFTLSKPVASVAQVQAVISNVPQNPGSAYTVSGNTITFTSAPPSGTSNIYVYYTSPITQVGALAQLSSTPAPQYFYINNAAPLGGATNPIVGQSGSADNYVQSYILNTSTGTSASADFTAYPNNGTDASGWVDMGITGSNYSSATYSVTGPNESYLFGSAPSGSGKTGNLVIATDSTGTTNNIQFYNGGFNKAKNAQSATISANGLGLGSAVATSGVGIAFPATQSASTDANTLDDYEEGTWTTSTGALTNCSSLTLQQPRYTKVGRLVTIDGYFDATITASNTLTYFSFTIPFPLISTTAGGCGAAITNNEFAPGGVYRASGVTDTIYMMFKASVGFSSGTNKLFFTYTYQTT